MRKPFLIAVLVVAILSGCQQAGVAIPPLDPVPPNAAPTPPSDLTPPKVVLKPKSTLGPGDQKHTYEQVMARGTPSNGEPVMIQMTEKEFFKLQGLTASIHEIDGHSFEVIFKSDEVVGLTSLGTSAVMPVLSPDHRSVALIRGQTVLSIYDIASGEIINIPHAEERFRPPKSLYHWGVTPLWSRDSKYLYFVGTPEGNSRLFRIDRDGCNLKQPYPDDGLSIIGVEQ